MSGDNSAQPQSAGKRGRLTRWAKRAFYGVTGLITLLLVLGLGYQITATIIDEGNYPPIGDLIDVGGHRLHAKVVGAGNVTVVFDSGLGNGLLTWTQIEPEVAKFARVFSYDRAGLGWSETGPKPRTSLQIASELHELLTRGGISDPYVLAGHSYGGINMQVFSSKFPDQIAGMILVDSSHEDQLEKIPPPPAAAKFIFQAILLSAPFGVPRLISSGSVLSRTEREMDLAVTMRTRHLYTALDERSAFETSLKEAREFSFSFGEKPLIVLT